MYIYYIILYYIILYYIILYYVILCYIILYYIILYYIIFYYIILYYIMLYSIIHKEYVARFHPFRDGSITLVPWWLRVSCGYRLDSPTSGVLPVILAEDGSNVAKCFQARWRLAMAGAWKMKNRGFNGERTPWLNIWQALIKQFFFLIV